MSYYRIMDLSKNNYTSGKTQATNIEYFSGCDINKKDSYDDLFCEKEVNPKDRNIKVEEWVVDGVLHRDSVDSKQADPARIEYFKNGSVLSKKWYTKGLLHNSQTDKPSVVEYHNTNTLKLEEWRQYGILHRFIDNIDGDLPAHIKYFNNGRVKLQQWFNQGQLGRLIQTVSPSSIEFYENGNIKRQEWYSFGLLHKADNLPAVIEYYPNGISKLHEWYVNGLKTDEWLNPLKHSVLSVLSVIVEPAKPSSNPLNSECQPTATIEHEEQCSYAKIAQPQKVDKLTGLSPDPLDTKSTEPAGLENIGRIAIDQIKPINGQDVDLDPPTIAKYQEQKNITADQCLNPPNNLDSSYKDFKPTEREEFEILIDECN